MTKNIIVPGSTPVSVDVAKLIEARNSYASATGSTYGMSKVYAAAMLVLFPYVPGKKPLFCKESGAEFEAWKGAALIAATKADTNKVLETADGLAKFKASLTDKVREIRKQAAMLCGLDTGNGAKANEKRETLDWLIDEAPKWLKRLNSDTSTNVKIEKAFGLMEKLVKVLDLNPDLILEQGGK